MPDFRTLYRAYSNVDLWFKEPTDALAFREEGKVNNNLIAILMWTLSWAQFRRLPSRAIVVTSLVREEDKGVHGCGRGADLRMSQDFHGNQRDVDGGLTLLQSQELETDINTVFVPYRGWKAGKTHECCVLRPHGNAPHLHLQCSARPGFYSSNRIISWRDAARDAEDTGDES